MKYLEWNNIISSNFFNSANAGKEIHLYLTKSDVINLGKSSFNELKDEEIWLDFIGAIKKGIPGSTGNILERAKYAHSKNNIVGLKKDDGRFATIDDVPVIYPPFISYLTFIVMPLIESVESNNLRSNNYYGRLNTFLSTNGINENIGTTDFSINQINSLWEDLSKWANNRENGDLGLFHVLPFENLNWVYVGKVFSQCVLPPKFLLRLPEIFELIGLVPDTVYDERFLYQKFVNIKTDLIPKSTLKFLEKGDELSISIIKKIKHEYEKWSGETHEEIKEGFTIKKKRNYTFAALFLQLKFNINDEIVFFSYRMFSNNDYPEDLKFGLQENLYEFNGWSKTLTIEFKEGLELKDNFNKWIAKFPKREVRLFISAGVFQLSNDYWIETDILSKTERMYLLCINEKKDIIKLWGESFSKDNFKEIFYDGLPENYSMFSFFNPSQGLSEIPVLTLYTDKKIELVGGLKVNFRTFISDFLPNVEIINSSGKEQVYLQYKGSNQKFLLPKSHSNFWVIPENVSLNTDFYIKVEGESFIGNEIAYSIISSDNSAVELNESNLPKRDSFGKSITIEKGQYCIGSNIINPATSSKRFTCPLSWIFNSRNEEIRQIITSELFNTHSGNSFCSFLSLKGVLTTEEFFKAFEFYYSKAFQMSGNVNLTKLKRTSLNFYDFIGILDYDYQTKRIVLNPPQFIFIPSDKGRKVLLIGARDAALIKAIIEKAPSYNLQVTIVKQFSSNESLLLPDVLTINAFGFSSENYGERNIELLSKELKIKFSNDYFPQLALEDFSANITDYENSMLEADDKDYDWARYIFNSDKLLFEKSETTTFDKSYSLLEYKLNEYTYQHKLWKDEKCYYVDKNWGRFLILKHFNKNEILFDSESKKVAIPVTMPLPRLLSEAIMLLSGLAPEFKDINGKKYRIYENVFGIFSQNLFKLKLGQTVINSKL
jgi:hypothetical protein